MERTDDEASRPLIDKARQEEAASPSNPDPAIEAWKRAVAAYPDELAPHRELARVLRTHARWRALAEALKEQRLKACRTAEDHVAALLEAVEVYRDHLRYDLLVANTLLEALSIQPGNVAILDQLIQHYESVKRWSDVVATLNKKVAVVEDAIARVAIFLKIADLHLDRFSNQAESIKALESVVELDPGHAQAISRLQQAYLKRRDWDKFIALERRRIAHLPVEAQLPELVTLARTAKERLHKTAAQAECWEAVVRLDPRHHEALSALEALCERDKRWDRLGEVLASLVEVTGDLRAKLALLQKLGGLQVERLGHFDAAIDTFRTLIALEPDHGPAYVALKKLYVQRQAWRELRHLFASQGKIEECVALLEKQAPAPDDPTIRELWAVTAVLCYGHLQQPSRGRGPFKKLLDSDEAVALKAYEEILDEFPEARAAIEAIEDLYQSEARHVELLSILGARLARTVDATERRDIFYRVARAAEWAEREDDAIAAYQSIVELSGDEPAALIALDRFYLKRQDWPALRATLLGQIAAQSSDADPSAEQERAHVRFRLGQLLEERFSDPTGAIECYRGALEGDPTHEGARAALERYLDGEHQPAVATILEPVYERQGDHARLAALYEGLAASSADPERCIELSHDAARLYEVELERPDLAVVALGRALHQEPTHQRTLSELERIGERIGTLEPLVNVLREVAAGPLDLPRQVDVRCRLARLYRKLGEKDRAIASYQRVIDLDEANVEALHALDVLYGESERHRDLLEVLRKQRRLTREGPQMIELEFRMAQLFEKHLGDPAAAHEIYRDIFARDPQHAPTLAAMAEVLSDGDRAIELWQRLLEIDGTDRAALTALTKLFREGARWAELLDVLKRQVGLAETDEERRPLAAALLELARATQAPDLQGAALELLVGELASVSPREQQASLAAELAEIETTALRRTAQAIEAWRRVLILDPVHLGALTALEHLFARESRWAECVEVLERRAALVGIDDRTEETELLLHAASIHERVGGLDAATAIYERVRSAMPSNPVASAQLEALYRTAGRWVEVVSVLKDRADLPENASNRIAILQEITRIHEVELGDLSAALAMLETALGDPSSAVPEAADLWVKVAQHAKVGERAMRAYEQALMLDPACAEAAVALEDIYRTSGLSIELLELLRARVDDCGPDEQVPILLEIGQLARELGDLPSAIDAYRSAILIEPGSRPALGALEAIYRSTDQAEERFDILERQLESCLVDPDAGALAELPTVLSAIEEILVDKEDYPALEKCYLAVVERLPEGSELLSETRRRLDDLQGSTLAQPESTANRPGDQPAAGAEWQTMVSELLDEADESNGPEDRRGDTHGEPQGQGGGGVRGRSAQTPRRSTPG
jgi:tetratricopeptide (TPR) repeat protein